MACTCAKDAQVVDKWLLQKMQQLQEEEMVIKSVARYILALRIKKVDCYVSDQEVLYGTYSY